MEGSKVFEESSAAPGTSSPRDGQSAVARCTSPSSPDADGGTGARDNALSVTENIRPMRCPEDNSLVHRKSVSLSELEVKTNKASLPLRNDASDDLATLQAIKEEKADARKTARPSPRAKNGAVVAQLASKFATHSSTSHEFSDHTKTLKDFDLMRGQIDRAAPFESVKAAVSKFGGIVDWKAHRLQTVERHKIIEQELEKAQEELTIYKKQSEAAEAAKHHVIKELESTRRLIEDLKLSLERAQTEERQAKQDSELAKLRVEELEQGIADEASVAARAQLEVARARHSAAVSELKSVQEELEQLRKDYDKLVAEKDAFVKKAEEAVAKSKQIEKSVEDLTIELITAKGSLRSAHAAHLEEEEHRLGAILEKEHDTLYWDKELQQAQKELEQLKEQLLLSKDLKSKLDSAMALLQDLKAELATYMEPIAESDDGNSKDFGASISAAKKELEEVQLNTEKAANEANILKVAATSLKSELEKEKIELATVQQKEGAVSIAVASLEAELARMDSEIDLIRSNEEEEREKMAELAKKLQEAAVAADKAKALAQKARDELRKAQEEAEQAKSGTSTMESRLRTTQKEIEAAKATEKLALAAINVLLEKEAAQETDGEDSPGGVTLSVEEYYELSKRAHEAEEQANSRVNDALAQVEAAKESELSSSNKLEDAKRVLSERKKTLEIALERAQKAKEGKLDAENELMKSKNFDDSPNSSILRQMSTPRSLTSCTETDMPPEIRVAKKKKRSFFPKIFMYLGKKKSRTAKTSA